MQIPAGNVNKTIGLQESQADQEALQAMDRMATRRKTSHLDIASSHTWPLGALANRPSFLEVEMETGCEYKIRTHSKL